MPPKYFSKGKSKHSLTQETIPIIKQAIKIKTKIESQLRFYS
jgi:hypothetical protein